jgi:fructosamine-3-kinase
VTGDGFDPDRTQSLGGGCINQAYRLSDGRLSYFVKTNRADALESFLAEAAALDALRATDTIRVPETVCAGSDAQQAWLVLEYVAMGRPGSGSQSRLGAGLAAMHRVTGDRFGWDRNNTIGATMQPNPRSGEWAAFWSEHRLGFQLDLAATRGYGGHLSDRGARLREALPGLFGSHQPAPSLLHGDLWSGNVGYDGDGVPVIFDPATYHGDRETDLAMTELFGGFDSDFYAAYRDAWPLDPDYLLRREIYNLYHVLNHLNLFGSGYLPQAESMMDRLLSETS